MAAGQPLAPVASPPRDESALNADFESFARRLLRAAERGDEAMLVALMAPMVDAVDGPVAPRRLLEILDFRPGEPLRSLRDALRLGAVRAGERFLAPAAMSGINDVDEAFVVGANVLVRDAPSQSGRPLTRLSNARVTVSLGHTFNRELFHRRDSPDEPSAWFKVVTAAGIEGYVYGRYIVANGDDSFYFGRVDGAWKLTALGSL